MFYSISDSSSQEGYSLDRIKMTDIGEHDRKIDNDERYHLNMSENIINITTMTNINGWIWPKIISVKFKG